MYKHSNLKKKFPLAILALTILALFISNVYAHTITVPTNVYFGFGNGVYINFNSAKTFDTAYRESGTWYFDNDWFTVSNANMTFTNYFIDDKLIFTLTGSTGSNATVYFYAYGRGLSVSVEGADYATVNSSGIHTITKTLQSSATITVTWLQPSGSTPGGWPPYTPPEEPPYIPPVILPSPEHAIKFEYAIIIVAVAIIGVLAVLGGRQKRSWKDSTVDYAKKWKKKTKRKYAR